MWLSSWEVRPVAGHARLPVGRVGGLHQVAPYIGAEVLVKRAGIGLAGWIHVAEADQDLVAAG